MEMPDIQPPNSGRSPIDAVLRRMIADRETRIGTLQDRIDSLERALHEKEARVAALSAHTAALDRLVDELVWDDGPRALRAVLPLARAIRRLTSR